MKPNTQQIHDACLRLRNLHIRAAEIRRQSNEENNALKALLIDHYGLEIGEKYSNGTETVKLEIVLVSDLVKGDPLEPIAYVRLSQQCEGKHVFSDMHFQSFVDSYTKI